MAVCFVGNTTAIQEMFKRVAEQSLGKAAERVGIGPAVTVDFQGLVPRSHLRALGSRACSAARPSSTGTRPAQEGWYSEEWKRIPSLRDKTIRNLANVYNVRRWIEQKLSGTGRASGDIVPTFRIRLQG